MHATPNKHTGWQGYGLVIWHGLCSTSDACTAGMMLCRVAQAFAYDPDGYWVELIQRGFAM